jgi:hypothetical protein
MNPHELMIKTNHHLIKGGELTEPQKANIVRRFLGAQSEERTKQDFYKGVGYSGNVDSSGGVTGTYPAYYIPAYNDNKKLQTVIPMSPKTHILSANAYELDIIRLLLLFAPDNPDVKNMVRGTLKRLKTTCFSNDCSMGECYHTALPALRFLTAEQNETAWIKRLVAKINAQIDDRKKCNGGTLGYYWLCLSELPYGIAEPEIIRYADMLRTRLSKSAVMNSEKDKTYNPALYCVMRNCLSRLPGYEYIKSRQPYISENDGRLHFDMSDNIF